MTPGAQISDSALASRMSLTHATADNETHLQSVRGKLYRYIPSKLTPGKLWLPFNSKFEIRNHFDFCRPGNSRYRLRDLKFYPFHVIPVILRSVNSPCWTHYLGLPPPLHLSMHLHYIQNKLTTQKKAFSCFSQDWPWLGWPSQISLITVFWIKGPHLKALY